MQILVNGLVLSVATATATVTVIVTTAVATAMAVMLLVNLHSGYEVEVIEWLGEVAGRINLPGPCSCIVHGSHQGHNQ